MEPENSSKEAERHAEISTEFISSEEPNSEADNHPGISRTQLSFENNNLEADVSSAKNDMETDLASVKNDMEDEVLSEKNNMEDEVISGKNKMEDEDQIEASSKPEPPRKKTTKKMRARRNIVKKSEQAGGNAEIFSKLQSSEEPNSKADNHPGISHTQVSFEKNNVEADVSSAKNDMETDLASVKNDMEGGVLSGTKSIEDEVLSGKKNMKDEVLSGKNKMEDDVISVKNNMEDKDQIEASSKPEPPRKKTTKKLRVRRKIVKKSEQAGGNAVIFSKLKSSEEPTGEAMNPPKDSTKQPSFGKNNMDSEVLLGKNNIMAENQGQASSKLESSSKRITKKLRARRKIVKKCVEAGGSAETFSKLQSSEKPGGKAVKPPEASTKQLSLGNNDMETEVLPGKNSMQGENQGEASSKPESSTKETSKMLKARPKILKKSLANESLKEMANGTSKVQQRNGRKNKTLSAREETRDKNVTSKVRNEGNLEIKNRERVRWSDKSRQSQGSEGKHRGSDETSRQKNKEKRDGIENSQQNEMKRDKIGGLIFMCSAKTKPDCFHYRVMGLSMKKKDLVLSIKPGLNLFLYDFDLKLLYGIYKASSSGGLNIERRAFGGAFPAQVRFDIHKDCFPLPESVFKKAIKENYNEKRKFKTELTAKQVRKLSELFRTLPGGPGHSPAMPVVRGGESYTKVKELRHHSSRERVRRDPYIDDNDRNYPILPRERREHVAYQEMMPQQREDISREMYLSEKDYRAYGLQGERRNLTPLRHVSPPRHAASTLERYQRDHARELLIRQPDLTYRDTVNVHRESSRTDPFYLTEREYQAYNLGSKLDLPSAALPVHPAASVTANGTVLDHYKRDPYHPYHHGPSSVDSYRLPVRRDEVSSGTYSTGGRVETYPGERDHFHRREPEQVGRLYSTYATDALSNYNRISHYQGDAPETAPAPVSSRYSFAGPSLSYR